LLFYCMILAWTFSSATHGKKSIVEDVHHEEISLLFMEPIEC
jgi:hypothetical protein